MNKFSFMPSRRIWVPAFAGKTNIGLANIKLSIPLYALISLVSLLFLLFLLPLVSFADDSDSVSLPPPGSMGISSGSSGSQDFGAQVTQNTQKGLQIFSGVNAASFLKADDADFSGFGSENAQDNKFPIDISTQDLSGKQSEIDTQIEGDWNES